MQEIISTSTVALPLPAPRVKITIRPGTMDDIPFMDALQKKTTKQVGWMPTKQFEGKVKAGHVLIAEQRHEGTQALRHEGADVSQPFVPQCLGASVPVGYLIGNDQYFKRDDVGIIYQINVVPEMRRSLVAASLLKAQFDRSAYGCKLYCCWCAQDIEANRFWEAMGFVALAFRTGGRHKGTKAQRHEGNAASSPSVPSCLSASVPSARIHIFWQKRIRQGDTTTPWWFPAKTDGGAIREDRIVLPIPPGLRWNEAMPVLLPGDDRDEPRALASGRGEAVRRSLPDGRGSLSSRSPSIMGGLRFAPPVAPVVAKPKREKRTKRKTDARLVAAARELRDRYLDEVNAGRHVVEPTAAKYALGREMITERGESMPLLAA